MEIYYIDRTSHQFIKQLQHTIHFLISNNIQYLFYQYKAKNMYSYQRKTQNTLSAYGIQYHLITVLFNISKGDSLDSLIIIIGVNMHCYCNSKTLYMRQYTSPLESFIIDNQSSLKKRTIDQNLILSSHPYSQLQAKIIQTTQLWTPSQIDRVSWDQITFNPLWFHKKYLSKNIPCIITDILQGDDIYERWADPQYLSQALLNQQQNISLTPDGFADSIIGDYFVQPHQEKASIKDFFNHQEVYPGAVPYIQHQNNNLMQEFASLNFQIPQDVVKHISQSFFKGKDPDAHNLWLGYDQSVSSLHKDPYQNFYLPIVGQKHFTLLPPHAILVLQQQQFTNARWKYSKNQNEGVFSLQQGQGTNKWICLNPDLQQDRQRFQQLNKIQSYHVAVGKEEMLYLPSLWYHQVSQVKGKMPYVMAINYWFDMEFTQNFSLYQTCRAIRNLT